MRTKQVKHKNMFKDCSYMKVQLQLFISTMIIPWRGNNWSLNWRANQKQWLLKDLLIASPKHESSMEIQNINIYSFIFLYSSKILSLHRLSSIHFNRFYFSPHISIPRTTARLMRLSTLYHVRIREIIPLTVKKNSTLQEVKVFRFFKSQSY